MTGQAVLGINAYHGDVSAVLIRDGTLVAAVEEERFRRVKHGRASHGKQSGPSWNWAASRLRIYSISPSLEILVPTCGKRLPLRWASVRGEHWFVTAWPTGAECGTLQVLLADTLGRPVNRVRPLLHGVEHHPAHLASAFFPSPFEQAAVCAVDGFGDFVSTSSAMGVGCISKFSSGCTSRTPSDFSTRR